MCRCKYSNHPKSSTHSSRDRLDPHNHLSVGLPQDMGCHQTSQQLALLFFCCAHPCHNSYHGYSRFPTHSTHNGQDILSPYSAWFLRHHHRTLLLLDWRRRLLCVCVCCCQLRMIWSILTTGPIHSTRNLRGRGLCCTVLAGIFWSNNSRLHVQVLCCGIFLLTHKSGCTETILTICPIHMGFLIHSCQA